MKKHLIISTVLHAVFFAVVVVTSGMQPKVWIKQRPKDRPVVVFTGSVQKGGGAPKTAKSSPGPGSSTVAKVTPTRMSATKTPPPPTPQATAKATAKATATPKATAAAKAPTPAKTAAPENTPAIVTTKKGEKATPKVTPSKATPAPTPTWAPPVAADARGTPSAAPDRKASTPVWVPPVPPEARGELALKASKGAPYPGGSSAPGASSGSPGSPSGSAEFSDMAGDGIVLDIWYRDRARALIGENFNPPRQYRNLGVTCTLAFDVRKSDGLISDVEVIRSTGDTFLDNIAKEALLSTKRLMPLPETVEKSVLRLAVTLDFSK